MTVHSSQLSLAYEVQCYRRLWGGGDGEIFFMTRKIYFIINTFLKKEVKTTFTRFIESTQTQLDSNMPINRI